MMQYETTAVRRHSNCNFVMSLSFERDEEETKKCFSKDVFFVCLFSEVFLESKFSFHFFYGLSSTSISFVQRTVVQY